MKCFICGTEYATAHICSGVAPAVVEQKYPPPPTGFAPLHYLQEAARIATWNDDAIQRTMNDPRALLYGLAIYCLATASFFFASIAMADRRRAQLQPVRVLIAFVFVLAMALFIDLIKIGCCHFLSTWFAGGSGKFRQLLGPLSLGSIVLFLAVIPLFGPIIAGLAWIAVFAMVFQEVHGVEHITAYLMSAGLGGLFFLLQSFLPAASH